MRLRVVVSLYIAIYSCWCLRNDDGQPLARSPARPLCLDDLKTSACWNQYLLASERVSEGASTCIFACPRRLLDPIESKRSLYIIDFLFLAKNQELQLSFLSRILIRSYLILLKLLDQIALDGLVSQQQWSQPSVALIFDWHSSPDRPTVRPTGRLTDWPSGSCGNGISDAMLSTRPLLINKQLISSSCKKCHQIS